MVDTSHDTVAHFLISLISLVGGVLAFVGSGLCVVFLVISLIYLNLEYWYFWIGYASGAFVFWMAGRHSIGVFRKGKIGPGKDPAES